MKVNNIYRHAGKQDIYLTNTTRNFSPPVFWSTIQGGTFLEQRSPKYSYVSIKQTERADGGHETLMMGTPPAVASCDRKHRRMFVKSRLELVDVKSISRSALTRK